MSLTGSSAATILPEVVEAYLFELVRSVVAQGKTVANFGLDHRYGQPARFFSSASTAPAVTNDLDEGYRAGDLWLRVSTGKLYVAVSVADGAADWQILN